MPRKRFGYSPTVGGAFGNSDASDRLITEFVARRRITDASPADSAATPGAHGTPAPTGPAMETNGEAPEALTVIELVNLYLGHCQTYAERNQALAADVMRQIG